MTICNVFIVTKAFLYILTNRSPAPRLKCSDTIHNRLLGQIGRSPTTGCCRRPRWSPDKKNYYRYHWLTDRIDFETRDGPDTDFI
jgi:hypothetical protein